MNSASFCFPSLFRYFSATRKVPVWSSVSYLYTLFRYASPIVLFQSTWKKGKANCSFWNCHFPAKDYLEILFPNIYPSRKRDIHSNFQQTFYYCLFLCVEFICIYVCGKKYRHFHFHLLPPTHADLNCYTHPTVIWSLLHLINNWYWWFPNKKENILYWVCN